MVKVGLRYRYVHEEGLGERHVDGSLASDMAELDMPSGTEVKAVGFDDERCLVLVEWTDKLGNPRITSIDPDLFNEDFVQVPA